VTNLRKKTGEARIGQRRPVSSQGNPVTTSPPLDGRTRHQKQLEVLNHFGTIDFDPDHDPLKLRQLDRDRIRIEQLK
jgi:hypothetical protein